MPPVEPSSPNFGLTLGPAIALVALELSPRQAGMQTPESAAARREFEFRMGRRAAALALARFAIDAEVPRGAGGCPIWPPGFVGSISHGATLAVAAVAPRESLRGIGIDVEGVLKSSACADVRERVGTSEELEQIHAARPALTVEECVTAVFSCKESLYKCLYPQVGIFFDFTDVRVSAARERGDHLEISLVLVRELGPRHLPGAHFKALFALQAGIARTAVLD